IAHPEDFEALTVECAVIDGSTVREGLKAALAAAGRGQGGVEAGPVIPRHLGDEVDGAAIEWCREGGALRQRALEFRLEIAGHEAARCLGGADPPEREPVLEELSGSGPIRLARLQQGS